MGLGHSPSIVMDGLIASLDAANTRCYPGTGNNVSGLVGGIGGTFINGVGFTSSNRGSFVFDGTDDYISIGTQSLIDGYQLPVTLMGWFKIDTYKLNTICGVYNGFANVYNLLRIDNSTYRFFLSNASNGQFQYFDHTTSLSLNTWYFYAVIVSGSLASPSLIMYLNDQAQSFSPSSLKTSVGLNIDYRIGASYTANEYFDGNIADYKFYNRALSAAEVRQNYNATKRRFGL